MNSKTPEQWTDANRRIPASPPAPSDADQDSRKMMNGKPVRYIPAKTVLNLTSGFAHKLLCDGPTFSTGIACAYSCTFCYVPDMMRKQQPYLQARGIDQPHEQVVIRRHGAVHALRQQLTYADGRPKFADPKDRRVIYSSPSVDVAANMELVRETIEACKDILELTHWDIRLLSKSNLLPKIADGIPPEHAQRIIYGVSTGTLEDGIAAAFEVGTARVSKRLESLHQLQDRGLRTYGMLCPSLPHSHDLYHEMAEQMALAIRAGQCEHVWAEVLNVRGESMVRTVAALNSAGYQREAKALHHVSTDPQAWEAYARATFEAHARVYSVGGKNASQRLRFLQYVTASSRPWWKAREPAGAILL